MSALPPLYTGWMEKALPGEIPGESKSTCDKCAMCVHADGRPGSGGTLFFNPQVKCCSYLPELPNFLVGGVLIDEDPAFQKGRASVEARLEAKVEVTPFGMGQFPSYSLLYANSDAFGRSVNLRCPHYIDEDGGRCGIWRHRNAVCVTWFCKHERGATGQKFWRTLLQLLSRVEQGLSRWCVLELDIGASALEKLFWLHATQRDRPKLDAKQIDQVADLEAHKQLWGKWLGREREFYQECARLVGDLAWEDITRICGPEVLAFTKMVQSAFDRLTSNRLPEAVRLKSVEITEMGLDSVQLKSYSDYDPLRLPRKLLEVLPYLESQPLQEALQTIEKEMKIKLSLDLVRKLIDFDILTAAPEPEARHLAEIPRSPREA